MGVYVEWVGGQKGRPKKWKYTMNGRLVLNMGGTTPIPAWLKAIEEERVGGRLQRELMEECFKSPSSAR
jgi:hypothetical protein